MLGDRPDRVAAGFVVVGTLLRFTWVLVLHHPFDHVYSDMAGYVARGELVASGQHLTRYDVFQSTGTQTLLALPFWIFGAGRAGLWAASVLWAALSSASVLFAWRLARRWLSPVAACMGTAFFAVWPLHIAYSGYFLSDTPALALLLAGLWLASRASPRSMFGGGMLLAGAAACRTELILNALIAAVFALRLFGARATAALACGFAVVALAVAIPNSYVAGTPMLFSQTGGLVFFEGQCEVRVVTGGYPWRPFEFGSPMRLQRNAGRDYAFPGTPVYDQGAFFRQGIRCIRNDGIGHLSVIADNLLGLTATSIPWPPYDEGGALRQVARFTNLLYCVLLPFLVVGSLIALRRGPRLATAPLAHLATPALIGVFFLGEPRYRIFYDVFGLMLAGLLLGRWRSSRVNPGARASRRWLPPHLGATASVGPREIRRSPSAQQRC